MIIGTAGHIDHGKTVAGARADRRRHRSPEGREGARHLDRSRLRLSAGARRLDARLRRCAGPREVRPQHAGGRDRHRFRSAGGRGRRRRDAADRGASRDRRPARHHARHRRADQGRSASTPSGARRSKPRSQNALLGTGLADAEILPVSVVTGRRHRCAAGNAVRGGGRALARAQRDGRFRLSVDRSFTLAGAGTVVTGTVLSGAVSVGDRVTDQPVRAFGARALDPCAEPRRRTRRGRPALRAQPRGRRHRQGRDRARRRRARSRAARADRPDRRDTACARHRAEADHPMDAGAAASRRERDRRRASCCSATRRSRPAREAPCSSCWNARSPPPRSTASCCAIPRRSAPSGRPLPRPARTGAQAPHARAARTA